MDFLRGRDRIHYQEDIKALLYISEFCDRCVLYAARRNLWPTKITINWTFVGIIGPLNFRAYGLKFLCTSVFIEVLLSSDSIGTMVNPTPKLILSLKKIFKKY